MHASEVIGYRHPDRAVRSAFLGVYFKFAESFHLRPESFVQFRDRMSEDRVATGEIVS